MGLSVISLLALAIGAANLVMAFARTPPEEAARNLAMWGERYGVPPWHRWLAKYKNWLAIRPKTVMSVAFVLISFGIGGLIWSYRNVVDVRPTANGTSSFQLSRPTNTPPNSAVPVHIYSPTIDQQRALLDAIIPLKSNLPARIWIVRPRDAGAQGVARIYERVFRTAGFDPEQEQQNQTDATQTGQIMMAVSDPNSPSDAAVKLAEAMKKVGFAMPLIPLSDNLRALDFAIFVGMNPL